MGYTKATKVLPERLLKAVQKYTDGVCLYIPRLQEKRKAWGAVSGGKMRTALRNQRIWAAYLQGLRVEELAARYFMTDKTVYKIIAAIKYKK